MSEVSEAATFHEAGHAVVALSLGFEVERVSIAGAVGQKGL